MWGRLNIGRFKKEQEEMAMIILALSIMGFLLMWWAERIERRVKEYDQRKQKKLLYKRKNRE
jgi:hypothetical protein